MKKLYCYGIGAVLLVSGLAAQAQHRPADSAYPLGNRQALVRQLQAEVATDLAQRAAPTVELRVGATKSFTGKVNYRQDLAKTGALLVGEIQDVPNSSFVLRVEDQEVDGNIILNNTRQAYSYAADKKGNVTVQLVDIDQVVCTDYNRPVGYQEPAKAAGAANLAAVVSRQSYPGARGCVLLDFDGYAMPAGNRWNNGNAYNAPSANMTDANIQAFWELVSEDYRPFHLNVTTDESVFNTYPKNMRMRCVVSPGSVSTIRPGTGGVAYVTSFRYNDDTPCWVFYSDPKVGGEAASHEVGHTLGLSHDGRISPAEGYYTGQGSWAPIMGASYYRPVTHWSRGEYNSANNTQDDLAIMAGTAYNVGYRTDDHSNTIAGATALTRVNNTLSGGGIIERTDDQDYFSFSTSGGSVNLSVNTVSRYGNLDIMVRLFNSGGTQLGTFDTSGGGNLNVLISTTLAAGTYYVQVDGTGSGNPATDGYSDYSSLGTFSILGTSPTTPLPVELVAFTARAQGGTSVALAWTTASEKNSARFEVERSTNGTTFGGIGNVPAAGTSSTWQSYTLTDEALPTSSGTLYYRLRQVDADGSSLYSPLRTVLRTAAAASQLVAYPNPAHERVYVQLLGPALLAPVQLLDAAGRTVRTQPTPGADGVLSLTGLPAGVYLLRCGPLAQRLALE